MWCALRQRKAASLTLMRKGGAHSRVGWEVWGGPTGPLPLVGHSSIQAPSIWMCPQSPCARRWGGRGARGLEDHAEGQRGGSRVWCREPARVRWAWPVQAWGWGVVSVPLPRVVPSPLFTPHPVPPLHGNMEQHLPPYLPPAPDLIPRACSRAWHSGGSGERGHGWVQARMGRVFGKVPSGGGGVGTGREAGRPA